MTPAKAERLRRKAQGRREEQRKRWWALVVVVLIIVAMFVGLAIIEARLTKVDEHSGRGPEIGGPGGHSDQE